MNTSIHSVFSFMLTSVINGNSLSLVLGADLSEEDDN